MKHLRIVVPAVAMWLIVAEGAFCQSSDSLQSVQNIVYGEVAGLLILGNLSLNYEYILGNHFSLRAGIGAGYLIEIAEDLHGSVGGLAMVNFFTAADHKLELGLGASCVFPKHDLNTESNFAPAVSVAYRYQTAAPGNFVRFGFTYDFRFGFPVQISWGRTF